MAQLFEFIDMMFKPTEFKKESLHERAKHFFMVNRFCSIKYPVQAAYFNHIKINPGQVVSFWQEMLSRAYSKTPGWMYVKTKKEKEKKKAEQPITDEIMKIYCEKFQMSERDFNDSITLLGDSFIKEVKMFENMINQ